MNLEAGTLVADRFRLVRELGQGGMGAVWLAHDTSLDTPCAIKFIHGAAAESAQVRARFEREAKSAALLRSSNVVQILDHGISGGTPYIAMELLVGEDLSQRLQRVGRLGPLDTVSILSQVAKALTRASAAGLVHRDLKPANIFLCRDEDGDVAKVLDFGVAKSNMPELGDAGTKTGSLLGTPFYMSPEQTRGTRAIDHRSDLWALAVIVFECLTGRLPFASESLGELVLMISADPLPVPSFLAPDLPPSFDAWWVRAAARDPDQRFQTARELIDALAAAFGLAHSRFTASGGGLAAGSGGPPPIGTSRNGAEGAFHPQTPGGSQPLPALWAGAGSKGSSPPSLVNPQAIERVSTAMPPTSTARHAAPTAMLQTATAILPTAMVETTPAVASHFTVGAITAGTLSPRETPARHPWLGVVVAGVAGALAMGAWAAWPRSPAPARPAAAADPRLPAAPLVSAAVTVAPLLPSSPEPAAQPISVTDPPDAQAAIRTAAPAWRPSPKAKAPAAPAPVQPPAANAADPFSVRR